YPGMAWHPIHMDTRAWPLLGPEAPALFVSCATADCATAAAINGISRKNFIGVVIIVGEAAVDCSGGASTPSSDARSLGILDSLRISFICYPCCASTGRNPTSL